MIRVNLKGWSGEWRGEGGLVGFCTRGGVGKGLGEQFVLELLKLRVVITVVDDEVVAEDRDCAKERSVELRKNPLGHRGTRLFDQHFLVLLVRLCIIDSAVAASL